LKYSERRGRNVQYHEVKFNLELNDKANCYWAGSRVSSGAWTTDLTQCVPDSITASLFIDYIYLDTEERRRFAQSSHEYLCKKGLKSGINTKTEIIVFKNNLVVSNHTTTASKCF